jgi:NAD(P)H-binding
MNDPRSLHVVLGSGPLGLAVARHLAAGGERVRAVSRSGQVDLPEGVEVLAADVADVADAKRACDGAAVVYHCANPPYAKWPELHPPLMESIIEGAAAARAKLVFGDNRPKWQDQSQDRRGALAGPRGGAGPSDDRARLRLLRPARAPLDGR